MKAEAHRTPGDSILVSKKLWIGIADILIKTDQDLKEIEKTVNELAMAENRCVSCGEVIPEGRQVCPNCEKGRMKMASETEKILNAIVGLKIGDTVRIRVAGDEMCAGWEDCFTVCGVSENYILAFHDNEYTIIHKLPTEYQYNGIPKGSCVCAPDNLIFGYAGGYCFGDPAWVKRYMDDLQAGTIEPSVRRRARIMQLERMGGG